MIQKAGTPVVWIRRNAAGEQCEQVATLVVGEPFTIVRNYDQAEVMSVRLSCNRLASPVDLHPAGTRFQKPAKPVKPPAELAAVGVATKSTATTAPTAARAAAAKPSPPPALAKPAAAATRAKRIEPPAKPVAAVSQLADRVDVLAIDFLNVLVRAFHAGKPTETHAVRSMFQTVAATIRALRPRCVVFCLDGGHVHRTALLPAYKAHRPPSPPELTRQKELAERAIQAAGFQAIRVNDFEADDVVASIARQNPATVICSADKDLLALGGVARIYHPWNGGEFVTAETKLGIPTGYVTDFLAMAGDSSDGIPGVKGVGEKTAAALLEEYGSLETILAAASVGQIKGSKGQLLKDQRAGALLCREVVELRDSLKLPELRSWRPPAGWQQSLQSMGLGNVAAILEALAKDVTHELNHSEEKPQQEEPSPSATTGQVERDNAGTDHPGVNHPAEPETPPVLLRKGNAPESEGAISRASGATRTEKQRENTFGPGQSSDSEDDYDRRLFYRNPRPPAADSSGSRIRICRDIGEPIRNNLSVAARFAGVDCGAISCWEAGREIAAAGADRPNPWRADTPNGIAWKQGRQGQSLDVLIEGVKR